MTSHCSLLSLTTTSLPVSATLASLKGGVNMLLKFTHCTFNWGKWGLQIFRCCSGFFYDLLDESSLRSWSNFGRPATTGKVHHCYKFSPFVDNGSDRGSLESQSLRNGFITLSRLIHVNYFVSHLFLNFFRSWHDVLLFKHASLCQTGSI